MLELKIPETDSYSNERKAFITIKGYTLQLEHSLISIAKWESKWHKPFLAKKEKTKEETLDYIRCMVLNKDADSIRYDLIPAEQLDEIVAYIQAPMTATTFNNPQNNPTNKMVITAEVIYYWMIAFNIPEAYRKWHLNQLLTLINVCSIMNQPTKKMSAAEKKNEAKRRYEINEQRRRDLNSHG
jgi:hypothetical protein